MSGIQSSMNKLIAGVLGSSAYAFNARQKELNQEMAKTNKRLEATSQKTQSVVKGLQKLMEEKKLMARATQVANSKIEAMTLQRENLAKRLKQSTEVNNK